MKKSIMNDRHLGLMLGIGLRIFLEFILPALILLVLCGLLGGCSSIKIADSNVDFTFKAKDSWNYAQPIKASADFMDRSGMIEGFFGPSATIKNVSGTIKGEFENVGNRGFPSYHLGKNSVD